ncbi:hypothetical protein N4R57_05990 [Rhodobacteraceae bacterium D3-12]|nr:hypothetical protein N4R57_05990 [Rhodobacteraceae bacterium D3-12]
MKNVFVTTATLAALFAGSAAFAEGGYVDEGGFINAAPASAYDSVKHENDNSVERQVQTNERAIPGTAVTTVFVADDAVQAAGSQGR